MKCSNDNVGIANMEEAVRHSSAIENSSVLFEKAIPVRIKSSCEDRHVELTIRIIMGISKHQRSTKVLQVQITNELDPFFLYSLEVNEDDFQNLKVEQCILVDFGTFPHKFIELLEYCIKAGANDAPRFLAVLNVRTGDSTFSVVETNQFKHLSHLSLCFRQGNDSTIKAYLAGRLAEYKGANSDLHEKLRRTLESLERSLQDVSNLRREVNEFKEMHSHATSELNAKHTMKLAQEREKAMQECIQMKEKLDRERADMEQRLRQRAEAQESHVAELEKQVRELTSTRHNLEMKATAMKTKLDALEKDSTERQQETSDLRTNNLHLSKELQESSSKLNSSLIRVASLEQEVQNKGELLSNMSRQLQDQTSHRSSVEISLKEAQAAAERAEDKLAAALSEANKYHQTIDKLQAELKSCKAKAKLKAQVTVQQETLINERQLIIDKHVSENGALRQEIVGLKSENDALRMKADGLKDKFVEAQEVAKSNQQMIQWLNQQLTDAQLGKYSSISSRYRSNGLLSHSPSSSSSTSSAATAAAAAAAATATIRNTKNLSTPTTNSSAGISKVIYTPTSALGFQSASSTQQQQDTAGSVTIVDLKRNGLPRPQLSFTSSSDRTSKSIYSRNVIADDATRVAPAVVSTR